MSQPIQRQLSYEEQIRRVMMTPLESCIMRPFKGSALYTLIDKPVDDSWILLAIAYIWDALERNVPGIEIRRVRIVGDSTATIHLDYRDADVEKTMTLGDAT